jgi:CHAT domain-containing protein
MLVVKSTVVMVVGLLLLGCSGGVAARQQDAGGAQVQSAAAHWPGARAGLSDGDVLLSWRTLGTAPSRLLPDRGPIRGAFDVLALETLRADLGAVVLSGKRAGATRHWRPMVGAFGLQVRPRVNALEATALDAALAELAAQRLDPACERLDALAQQWQAEARPADAIWAQWLCLDALVRGKREVDLERRLSAVLASAPTDPGEAVRRTVLMLRLGFAAADASLWRLCADLLARVPQFSDAATQAEVSSLTTLMRGTAALYESRYNDVLALQQRTHSDLQRTAAHTLRLARALAEDGWARLRIGQINAGTDSIVQAVAIARAVDAEGADAAKFAGYLGIAQQQAGDLSAAEKSLRSALDVVERLHPNGQRLASTLNNLAIVLVSRGDLAAAEAIYQRALAVTQVANPGGVSAVRAMFNLASLELRRGNFEAAERWALQGIPILEGTGNPGDMPGHAYDLLGSIAHGRGDYASAEDWFKRSEAAMRTAGSMTSLSSPLKNLGEISLRKGDLQAARFYILSALAIRRETEPNGGSEATSWYQLGDLDLRSGRPREALLVLREADHIQARSMPDSLEYASTLNAIGRARLQLGDVAAAREALCAAVVALDRSRPQISASPGAQSEALANYQSMRQDCIEQKLRAGDSAGAFDELERGRGLALRALLAQRDLAFKSELPEALRQRWRALELALERQRGQRMALPLDADPALIARAQADSDALQQQRTALIAQIRRVAPRFADLQFPQSLGSAALRSLLPADTALIAYLLGEQHSYAFVLRADRSALAVHELDLVEPAVSAEMAKLSASLEAASELTPALESALRSWHARLVAPLETDLSGIDRLIIVPDAELLQLPFAGLVDADDRFLFERFSTVISDSATLWARAAPPIPAQQRLVAVANDGAATNTLPPLPTLTYVRREVEAIGTLFASRELFDERSGTENALRSSSARASVLHFATHSVYDPLTPLDSGLLLGADASQPGARGDGFLQAWEIFDEWRLHADLVTLSACATGRGKVLAGEGLIGLTRAFQYAGARNVLASLWNVSDRSTADLMTAFYRELEHGVTIDRALQRAQQLQLAHLRQRKPDASARRGVGGLVTQGSAHSANPLALLAFQIFGSRED